MNEQEFAMLMASEGYRQITVHEGRESFVAWTNYEDSWMATLEVALDVPEDKCLQRFTQEEMISIVRHELELDPLEKIDVKRMRFVLARIHFREMTVRRGTRIHRGWGRDKLDGKWREA